MHLTPLCYSTRLYVLLLFFFFNDTATTEIYTLSLHDALPISHHGRPEPHQRRRPEHRQHVVPPADRAGVRQRRTGPAARRPQRAVHRRAAADPEHLWLARARSRGSSGDPRSPGAARCEARGETHAGELEGRRGRDPAVESRASPGGPDRGAGGERRQRRVETRINPPPWARPPPAAAATPLTCPMNRTFSRGRMRGGSTRPTPA